MNIVRVSIGKKALLRSDMSDAEFQAILPPEYCTWSSALMHFGMCIKVGFCYPPIEHTMAYISIVREIVITLILTWPDNGCNNEDMAEQDRKKTFN